MIPMRTSSVFKSRWMALIWAAGFLWFAYDFAGGSDSSASNEASANEATDVSGAPVTTDQQKQVAGIIANL
jgi:hypothetical protein